MNSSLPYADMPFNLCYICHKWTQSSCSNCTSIYYCSIRCQSSDWARHSVEECTQRPVDARVEELFRKEVIEQENVPKERISINPTPHAFSYLNEDYLGEFSNILNFKMDPYIKSLEMPERSSEDFRSRAQSEELICRSTNTSNFEIQERSSEDFRSRAQSEELICRSTNTSNFEIQERSSEDFRSRAQSEELICRSTNTSSFEIQERSSEDFRSRAQSEELICRSTNTSSFEQEERPPEGSFYLSDLQSEERTYESSPTLEQLNQRLLDCMRADFIAKRGGM